MIVNYQGGIMENGRQKEYLTVREVAERWGVSIKTVKSRINTGLLEAIQISTRGDKRIALNEVERFERELRFER